MYCDNTCNTGNRFVTTNHTKYNIIKCNIISNIGTNTNKPTNKLINNNKLSNRVINER